MKSILGTQLVDHGLNPPKYDRFTSGVCYAGLKITLNFSWKHQVVCMKKIIVPVVGIVPTSPLSEPEPTLPFGLSLSEPTYLHLPTF